MMHPKDILLATVEATLLNDSIPTKRFGEVGTITASYILGQDTDFK
jgi:hypothetical protein